MFSGITLGAALKAFASGAAALIGLLPSWAKGAIVAAIAMLFVYEGFPPFYVALPFIGEISIVDGRVDNVREAADARCRLQKVESRRQAERADRLREQEAARQAAEQIREANERALAAQRQASEYERDIRAMEPALQECRRATPADDARVQP